MAANIHPKWLIEEKAINFRKDVWFSPPSDPMIIDKIIILKIKLKFRQYEHNIKGAIFCQVIKIKLFHQLSPSITPGNQKWKGAAPLFKSKEDKIANVIKFESKLIIEKIFNWRTKKIDLNKKIAEANAWVRKYFKEASVESKLFVSIIKGIKDNKLISNPIQAPSQELEETEIKVPLISVVKNK